MGSTWVASGDIVSQADAAWALTFVNRADGFLLVGATGCLCFVSSHCADDNCLHPFTAFPFGRGEQS